MRGDHGGALHVSRLLTRRQAGRTLDRAFYTDAGVYEADLDRVWRRSWLFACHSLEVREPGAWLVASFGDDSLIISRDETGRLHAHYNVCAHRGTRLLEDGSRGRSRALACPYHHWVYGLDGALRSAPGTPEGWEACPRGLAPAPAREVAGLVFVCPGEAAEAFEPAAEAIGAQADPHGLADAAIASVMEYEIAANWKIVVENNRECYHCPGNHPEYCAGTYDTARDRGTLADEIAARVEALRARAAANGIDPASVGVSSAMTGTWFRANRTPLRPGFVTESLDGGPVSIPMGRLAEVDVGTCRVTTFPNFWMHAGGDHAVTTRLTPAGPERTLARVTWLVSGQAVPGRDYDPGRVEHVWRATSEQDRAICERQQLGVRSPAYRAGPLVPGYEDNVALFLDWYAGMLGRGGAGDGD